MPFKHNAVCRHRIPWARTRVTNWPAHEAGLRRRSSLALWLDEAALTGRAAPKRSSPGEQPRHSGLAIELVLALRLESHLALRQAETFSRRAVPAWAGPDHPADGLACAGIAQKGSPGAALRGGTVPLRPC